MAYFVVKKQTGRDHTIEADDAAVTETGALLLIETSDGARDRTVAAYPTGAWTSAYTQESNQG